MHLLHRSLPCVFLCTAFWLVWSQVPVSHCCAEDGIGLSRATLAARVAEIEQGNDLSRFTDLNQWQLAQEDLRKQLIEMLGLPSHENRPALQSQVMGQIENESIVVEKIQFQSLPGVYVTANLYRPKTGQLPLPAVLYVCGHGQVKEDGISLGNKTYYQQHPAWFAEHGYLCMAIDTVQLGEIEGMHHGLYRYKRWDWPARGYTPAGIEAWNSIRAIDYLLTRPDVDPNRLGITGRSGGGAYSWFAAAVDPRIQVAVPVAGITDLRDHVIGQCVQGHCDCMYLINRYGWDYSTLAAMVHPRALLIGNTDEDPIFPLAGVFRIRNQLRHVYKLGALDHLGIQWTNGGHDDTQELQVGCFVWFDRFLLGERRVVRDPATARFERRELRVLSAIPKDERVTDVHDWFVPMADTRMPENLAAWEKRRQAIESEVRQSVEGRLPWAPPSRVAQPPALASQLVKEKQGNDVRVACIDVEVPPASKCRLVVFDIGQPDDRDPISVVVADSARWEVCNRLWDSKATDAEFPDAWWSDAKMDRARGRTVWVFPEGRGPWGFDLDEAAGLHVRRSYLLCGWSLEGRQVAGVSQAIRFLRERYPHAKMSLHGENETNEIALHTALLESESIAKLCLRSLKASYRDGFVVMGALRFFDLPEVLAVVADRTQLVLNSDPQSLSRIDLRILRRIEELRNRSLITHQSNLP